MKIPFVCRVCGLLFSVWLAFLASAAQALFTPISVGVVPPLAIPPNNFVVAGARVSLLWGKSESVYGIDIGGLGNLTYVTSVGSEISGVFNVTHGMTTIIGLQAAGLANFNTNRTNVAGVQLAALINRNTAETSIYGVQMALLNIGMHTDIRGVQIGLINTAQSVIGLQIGLFNRATSVHGLQLGLINLNDTGPMKAFLIVNGGF